MLLKLHVFWFTAPCRRVKAVHGQFFEASVIIYKSTRPNIPLFNLQSVNFVGFQCAIHVVKLVSVHCTEPLFCKIYAHLNLIRVRTKGGGLGKVALSSQVNYKNINKSNIGGAACSSLYMCTYMKLCKLCCIFHP